MIMMKKGRPIASASVGTNGTSGANAPAALRSNPSHVEPSLEQHIQRAPRGKEGIVPLVQARRRGCVASNRAIDHH
jgi:hypothetical protein